MLVHHLKRTLRNLWRNRFYTTLHLFGLTVGMAAAMLVALWVQNELRFDRYHHRAESLWRIKTDLKITDTETWHWGTTPMKITELCAQTPGVIATTQCMLPQGLTAVLQRGGSLFEEEKFAYVGPGWFDAFDYDCTEGSLTGFGERPNDLLLTERLARKIFGDHPAIGQTLRMDSTDFIVHAVLRDPRPESSFRENLLLPIEAYLRVGRNRQNDESWDNFNYNTFVELHPNTAPEAVSAQLTNLLVAAKKDSSIALQLGALTDVHFDQTLKDDSFEKGSRWSVATFALVGLLILLMAAINYINLTTARAQTRAREAGIRKIVGAGRGQLFAQFLSESALLAAMAGLLALGTVKAALPWFSDIAGRDFVLPLETPLPWILLGSTLAGVVLLAGIYPAVLMAGFQPMQVLRKSGSTTDGSHRSALRQGLVVSQFTISVALLICTLVIGQQRAFIQHKEMGYERAQIVGFEVGWFLTRRFSEEQRESMGKTLEQTLRQSSAIVDVTRANSSPVLIKSSHSGSVKFDGMPEGSRPTVSQLAADEHFADFFGLKLAEGRWFEPGNTSDANNVVLNETAARTLGLPQPWVGQRFGFHGREGRVVGLVRDFHFLPLHEQIGPLVIFNANNWRSNFFIKTQPGQTRQALAAAEAAWQQFFPNRPFTYAFLDEDFNRMYQTEQRAGLLFNFFAGIAIFIASLGLFGLVTFVAVQRTKEIGIRKVLGASVAGITGLLARDFLKLVLVSVVIACPVAYWLMQRWLADFAYHIDLSGWIFAGAGAAAVAIALLTVGFQAVRAALANPVHSLKSE